MDIEINLWLQDAIVDHLIEVAKEKYKLDNPNTTSGGLKDLIAFDESRHYDGKITIQCHFVGDRWNCQNYSWSYKEAFKEFLKACQENS